MVDTEASRLARAIAAVAAVIDPQLVVLGGGVGTGGGDLLLPRVRDSLRALSPFSPQLAISALGSGAVLAGSRSMGTRLVLDRLLGETGQLGLEGRRWLDTFRGMERPGRARRAAVPTRGLPAGRAAPPRRMVRPAQAAAPVEAARPSAAQPGDPG